MRMNEAPQNIFTHFKIVPVNHVKSVSELKINKTRSRVRSQREITLGMRKIAKFVIVHTAS